MIRKLPFQNSVLLESIKYSIVSGGKRIRPCLIYVFGTMFKVNIITLDSISLAVECIHLYSLIHDDLPCMDNDDFRRGKLTCHKRYGEDVSLIAGDAFQSLSFNILSSRSMPGVSYYKRLKMISELSNSIGFSGMCMGQVLDLRAGKSTNKLEKINLYKTAFLIRSSVRLAYLSSKYFSKTTLSTLDRFSIAIGLAFQIQDDIIDFKSDVKKFKKSNSRIYTYPFKFGLDQSYEKIKKLYQEAFFALRDLKKKFNISTLEILIKFIINTI